MGFNNALEQLAQTVGRPSKEHKVRTPKGKTANKPAIKAVDLRLPEGRDERIVYSILHALSVAQHAEGFEVQDRDGNVTRKHSHVVPIWMILRDLRDTGYLAELESRPTEILVRLAASGHVKMAGKAWIPSCFDTPYVKGAKAVKGGRASDIRRMVDAMLEAPDRTDESAA